MVRRRISETRFAAYSWLFQVLIVLALTSVVIWLSLKPRTPYFTITDAYIQYMSTHNSTTRTNETAANVRLVFNLQISNPNKGVGIYYGVVSTNVNLDDLLVGNSSSPAFYQGHKMMTELEVLIDTGKQFWSGTSKGDVELRVTVETSVRYKIFRWKTKHYQMGFEGLVRIQTNGSTSTSMKSIIRYRLTKFEA